MEAGRVAVILTGVGKRYDIVSAFAEHAFTIAADGSAGRARCGIANSASVAISSGQMSGWSCQGMEPPICCDAL